MHQQIKHPIDTIIRINLKLESGSVHWIIYRQMTESLRVNNGRMMYEVSD